MQDIGFWRDPRDPDDDRPDPRTLVDLAWAGGKEQKLVAAYLRSGFVASYELGCSFCRFDDCRALSQELGCATLTDGERWEWPEGFQHYVTVHAVRPPQEFVADAARDWQRLWRLQHGGDGGSTRGGKSGSASSDASSRGDGGVGGSSSSTGENGRSSCSKSGGKRLLWSPEVGAAVPLSAGCEEYLRAHGTAGTLPEWPLELLSEEENDGVAK